MQDRPQSLAFFGILDLARNTALIAVRHQDQITSRQADIGRDARALVADRAFGDLHHHFRTDRINLRHVFGRDLFLGFAFVGAIDLFDAAVQAGKRIPEMKESVFLEADVDKHGLQTMFDVFDFSFEDTANDVSIGVPFDVVFFEYAIFEERDAPLEFFTTDDYLIAGLTI